MRNKIVIYSPKTDLRGKRVELRSGEIVDIPKDAQRSPCEYPYVSYVAMINDAVRSIFQNTHRININAYETDIMKVIK